ncbi:MAG: putative metal-binding motif-containing protein, partial [Myxococcota bacterium]|nr:putative metal-binding motif-containing protein [Myxococcota bacterium]
MLFIFSIVLYGCGNTNAPDTGLESEPEPIVQDYDEDGFFNDVDCNDLDPEIHPDAIEVCDGIDNDCDSYIDDEDENLLPDKTWYRDVDEDGFGDPSNSVQSCSAAIGFVANNEDCDDNNAQINPTAIEICDQDDNNCNGLIDSADETLDPSELVALIPDEDGDGYGAPSLTIYGCPNDPSPSNRLDCDDNNAQINPAMADYCDGIDNNCDEQVDTIDEMYLLSGSEIVYYEPDQDIVFEQDGVVHNCYETLDMNIEFKASVDMLNHKEGTQLNGNILIYVNQNVSIDNLNIYSNATHPEEVCIDCPPALMCTFGVDLTYSNGAITFGSAIEGGGIFGRACNVTLQNTTIQNTTAL